MTPVLKLDRVDLGYPGKPVLKDVSFGLLPGEMAGVTGPNGSGKTTLIKAAAGLIRPEKGGIFINGQNIRAMSHMERARRIAAARQSSDAPHMTVEAHTLLGRLPFFKKYQFFETEKDRSTARKYMRLTGVLALKDKRMDEISQGERQLAGIARALCQEPALLMLDEPTSNLDIARQVQILELVDHLRKEMGMAVLTALHDLNLASEYSDRIIMVNGKTGKVRDMGAPEDALTEDSIREVYDARVSVSRNPDSGKPRVFVKRPPAALRTPSPRSG
ncbi:ABC cobalamin/iron(III) transporter, ATP-binding protein [Candidatus Desulfarcum epimagneticum]|uniref:ABC cobalamin/iron(III) transporter, ATP-binding protein n=1 Tax=uncultured Desulfobacteraceae bacterium TaxID=218296 RepID=A0A484HIN0_9BACT|nr:ABC cobalamin/iron(III) transporter, ATP-binding protein [uncultured Desulfobacteraceae bacterium]